MADDLEILKFLPCYENPGFDPGNMTVYKITYACSFVSINLTTCLPIETQGEQETIASLCHAADKIWDVCFWLAIATGVVGNSLAILTIASLPMSTATFYVCLLAVSDLLAVLVRGILQLLKNHGILQMYGDEFHLSAMLFDYCASFSNWLLVLICFERFLTIRFPLRKRMCFTLRRAQMVAFIVAVALLLAYGVATWRLGYTDSRIFNFRNLLYAVLPLSLILIIIALISCHLKRVHLDREATFSSSQRSSTFRPASVSSCSCSYNNIGNGNANNNNSCSVNMTQALVNPPQTPAPRKNKNTLQEIARLENTLTVMMLVAAIVFSLLTIPHCVMFYIYQHSVSSWGSPVVGAQFYLLNKISLVMTFFNLSINFVLYFLSAKKFRSQLFQVFRPGAWIRALLDAKTRAGQAPQCNTTLETPPLDPIANGEYVSLRLLNTSSSGISSNGLISIKSTGKVQFTLDQSYYD